MASASSHHNTHSPHHAGPSHSSHHGGISKKDEKQWHQEHIVPHLIKDLPPHITTIQFDSGKHADEGNELTPTEVKHVPKIQWPLESGAHYTLMTIDPDAPQRDDPKFRYWLHWLVVNISSEDLSKGTTTLAHYVGSAPPPGSLHRYITFIYKQSKVYDCSHEPKLDGAADRKHFNPETFLKKHDDAAVLVSGNFWQAKYDSHCDTVWKNLK